MTEINFRANKKVYMYVYVCIYIISYNIYLVWLKSSIMVKIHKI